MQEVSEAMYNSSIFKSEEQIMMEGHERFLAMKRAMYRNGYDAAKEEAAAKYDKIINERDARIAELEAQLAALKK